MGLMDAWGHDPLFDYCDEYVKRTEHRDPHERAWDPWTLKVWEAVR